MNYMNLTDLFNLDDILVLDLETTVCDQNGNTDNSPFNLKNKAVGCWWLWIENKVIGDINKSVWYHNEKTRPDTRDELQKALDRAKLIVAHNAKFDIIWLLEIGFEINCPIYCSMIGEFIFARAQPQKLSLKETAIRRRVTHKKSDLVDAMFKDGIGFEAMPLSTVDEYAEADVISCAEIFVQQVNDLQEEKNRGLGPVFCLMNDNMQVLIEMERNGIKIDLEALDQVEKEYLEEKEILTKRQSKIAAEVLGDTPFNLSSGASQCMIVYGRTVTDKDLHARLFNIGTGPNGKPLPQPYMSNSQYKDSVRSSTKVVKKTRAEQCPSCNGSGRQYKVTKKGVPFKNQPKCTLCEGSGAIYIDTKETAGLKLSPLGPRYACIHGFKVDKKTIEELIEQAKHKNNDIAVEYLTNHSRLNAINTYLNSFVNGIRTWVRSDGILHANFNQTVARTGRLSSSGPNLQNFPKSGKFPIRKCMISRFEDQNLIESDFAQLEFRIAGELSQDRQIIDDILSGKDIHSQTASIILKKQPSEVTKQERSVVGKPYTFQPLYGGGANGKPPHIKAYFDSYFEIYSGLKTWHEKLISGVLSDGIVRTPSGREFYFPDAKRQKNGRVRNQPSIVNYPVQSFATGDCVVLACIRFLTYLRKHNLKSKFILTVHDSLVVDVAPNETKEIVAGLKWAMKGLKEDLVSRFNFEPTVPLDIDIEIGKNWMEMSELV
tara:strand:+ start:1470 stop:3617 length:2148 start_codon:yes stop_codon:yes gene_type:complete